MSVFCFNFKDSPFQTTEMIVVSLHRLSYGSKIILWLWVKLSVQNMFTEQSNSDFNERAFISVKQHIIMRNWGVTYRNNTVHDSRFRLYNSLLSYLAGTS